MKKLNLKAILAFAMALMFSTTYANNLRITGTSVAGSNITFNIAWDNSWYATVAPSNWDAAWVFIKYQDCATQQWYHAGLSTVVGDHTAGSPLVVETVTDGKGVFIRRGAAGGGNIASTSVTLKMTIPAGTYNYKVFGVEMVKVLQDTFQLGDATSGGTYSSITIDAVRQAAGISGAVLGNNAGTAISASFPMGYNGIYCMKYETTQQQYVDFLNTLQYHQQETRTGVAPNSIAGTLVLGSRSFWSSIVIQTPGSNSAIPATYACDLVAGSYNDIDDGQNKACNYMMWGDLAAYLDWAALRPMTEMEFEKVCRGPLPRVAGEYPWGSTAIQNISSASVTSVGTATEGTTITGNGLCNYSTQPNAPMRVGFTATGSTGRQSAGAAYYGAMDMGGNLWEMIVTTYNVQGAAYTGATGDGDLTLTGEANVTTWPDPVTALGSGLRGGSVGNTAIYVRTSDRNDQNAAMTTRTSSVGGRGVR